MYLILYTITTMSHSFYLIERQYNLKCVPRSVGDSSVLQHQIKITQAEIPFKCCWRLPCVLINTYIFKNNIFNDYFGIKNIFQYMTIIIDALHNINKHYLKFNVFWRNITKAEKTAVMTDTRPVLNRY
jgi:cyclopropane fatty-acyl-phospholipid synthase-like methyltransferase